MEKRYNNDYCLCKVANEFNLKIKTHFVPDTKKMFHSQDVSFLLSQGNNDPLQIEYTCYGDLILGDCGMFNYVNGERAIEVINAIKSIADEHPFESAVIVDLYKDFPDEEQWG